MPTLHLGASANALERRGFQTRIGDRNRSAQVFNARVKAVGELERPRHDPVPEKTQPRPRSLSEIRMGMAAFVGNFASHKKNVEEAERRKKERRQQEEKRRQEAFARVMAMKKRVPEDRLSSNVDMAYAGYFSAWRQETAPPWTADTLRQADAYIAARLIAEGRDLTKITAALEKHSPAAALLTEAAYAENLVARTAERPDVQEQRKEAQERKQERERQRQEQKTRRRGRAADAVGISARRFGRGWGVSFREPDFRRGVLPVALRAQVATEEARLAEMKSKTWGLTLGDDGKMARIVLPDGTDFDTETPWTWKDAGRGLPGHNPAIGGQVKGGAPMTQSRNIDLTPEEQAELAENMPQLLDAIEKGSPVAPAWLANWRSKRTVAEEAREQAAEIQKAVAAAVEAAGPEQVSLAQWCGFPTDMTRCSPFFPMRNNELGERRFLRNYIITSANWGEIRYTGPQLSIYEEDSLMALLAVLDGKSQYRKDGFVCDLPEKFNRELGGFDDVPVVFKDPEDAPIETRKTYTYKGPALPLLRILYGQRTPSKKDYVRLVDSLKLMTVAGCDLSISTGKTKTGKRRAPRITQMSAMLAGVHWDDKKKELTATINPFFYETYLAGRVTLMDVAKRMSLKGLNAKALYRFVQSQRQNPVFVGHFLTLADALNMDREQPAKKIRQLLKAAINELIRQGVLMKKSGFVDADIIKLNRAEDALPQKEKKNELTDEERALYGLMVLAEENTKLAKTTLEALPRELTATLAPVLEDVSKSVADAKTAFVALPDVVQEAEQRMRSASLHAALVGAGVCLSVSLIFGVVFYLWHSGMQEEQATLAAALKSLKAQVATEEARLAEMKSKTWGLTLGDDGKNRFIVLPDGTDFDTETPWTWKDAGRGLPGHNPAIGGQVKGGAPMTQSRNIDLTPEEQAELAENMPQLLDAIEKGSPVAPAWLANWRSKRTVAEEAREQAAEIQKAVAAAVEAAGPEQVSLAQWCGFPTDMTRCSPFFPMRNNELGERRFLRNYIITSANWGEIRYTGPQLSIYEEDSLMALLAVLDGKSQYRKDGFVCDLPEKFNRELGGFDDVPVVFKDPEDAPIETRKTYTYKGPALPLLRILYGQRTPSKKDYVRLVDSLKLMTVAGCDLSISTGKTKTGKRRAPRITQMSAMLAGVHWDDKKKELTATINPFFYETYLAGRVTLMDVAKRMSLKGLNAKALYRFVQSQRQNPVFVGHFLTLADALNMDREQPAKKIRQLLKAAINELIRQGVLMKKSGFVDADIIKLNRAEDALPQKEKKKSTNN
ncbi:hypothetical protein M514_27937 [Trichuris suis]|uniref:Uncharacterized protein n=1 Tax=Trichuris suis TaxID=68888 RepID=A0A085MRP3_9BILA|nr:hypothetical protein M514_27937 [Trichuris suis]